MDKARAHSDFRGLIKRGFTNVTRGCWSRNSPVTGDRLVFLHEGRAIMRP
jgi:hypothetical protein